MSRWESAVLDHLEQHTGQIVGAVSDLVRIPSIGGTDEENTVSARLRDEMAALELDVDHWEIPLADTLAAPDFPGVEVDRREAWGLVGALRGRGDGPSLMLNAHVDVVPPGDGHAWPRDPFDGAVTADAIHGRGACDMKGGLVAALWAVRAIRRVGVPLRGDLLFAAVQGEEDGGLGTYATLARGWRADACLIPEPTSLDVVPANGGSLTFRITVSGLAAHASRRRRGVSAIEKFFPLFAALRELEAERNRDPDPLMSRWDLAYPIEIGTVTSGDWSSTVPDLLVAEGRYGVQLGEDPAAARAAFAAALARAGAGDPWLADHPPVLQWWGGQFAPGRTDVDASIVRTLRGAHEAVSAHVQQTYGAPYGSDLRLMTGLGGVPTVHYGPGDAAFAHAPSEHVPIGEVLTTARTLALVALRHCGVA